MAKKQMQNVWREIKEQARPKEVLHFLGLNPTREKNGQIWLECPFHDDDEPSLKFDTKHDPPLYKCFGCGASGSVLDFVMEMHGVDVVKATKQLANGLNIDIAMKPDEKSQMKSEYQQSKNFEKFAECAHELLIEGRKEDSRIEAIYNHLISNRHVDEEIIKEAKIGFGGFYDPKSHDALFEALKEKGLSYEEINELGLFWERNGELRNTFLGYYTLPFIDKVGNMKFMTGRLYEDGSGHEVPEFLYRNHESPPRYKQLASKLDFVEKKQIYNEQLAYEMIRKEEKDIFITEGQFDALALCKEGYPALAMSGTSNTERYGQGLVNFIEGCEDKINNINICFDREDTSKMFMDDKSTKKAFSLGEYLIQEGMDPSIIKLPKDLLEPYSDKINRGKLVAEIDPEELMHYSTILDDDEKTNVEGPEIFRWVLRNNRKKLTSYKIESIVNEEDKIEKSNKIEKFMSLISNFNETTQKFYISDLKDAEPALNKRELQDKLQEAESKAQQEENKNDIKGKIKAIRDKYNDKGDRVEKITNLIVDKLQDYGRNSRVPNVFFFNESKTETYLLFDGKFVQIRDSMEFNAVLRELTSDAINQVFAESKAIVKSLQSHVINNGEELGDISWNEIVVDHDRSGDIEDLRAYFPMCNSMNELIKIESNELPVVTENAVNDDNAIIRRPTNMNEWDYDKDINMQNTMDEFKETVWDNLPVRGANKLFICASLFTLPILDDIATSAHIRLKGKSSSGKSFIGKIITSFILGEKHISNTSNAALRRLLENSPMVCLDEFEKEDFNRSRMELLRLAVTKSEYDKQDRKNTQKTIRQKFKALVYTTGIDTIEAVENQNRTIVMPVHERWQSGVKFKRIQRQMDARRDSFLSAMMQMTSDVILPQYLGENQHDGKSMHDKILDYLDDEWGQHPLQRLFGFIALTAMYAKELSKYFPKVDLSEIGEDEEELQRGTMSYIKAVLDLWLHEQKEITYRAMSNSSTFITLLETLRSRYQTAERQILGSYGRAGQDYTEASEYMHAEFGVDVEKGDDHFTIESSVVQLYNAFNQAASRGQQTPANPSDLISRIENDEDLLEQNGWDLDIDRNEANPTKDSVITVSKRI